MSVFFTSIHMMVLSLYQFTLNFHQQTTRCQHTSLFSLEFGLGSFSPAEAQLVAAAGLPQSPCHETHCWLDRPPNLEPMQFIAAPGDLDQRTAQVCGKLDSPGWRSYSRSWPLAHQQGKLCWHGGFIGKKSDQRWTEPCNEQAEAFGLCPEKEI